MVNTSTENSATPGPAAAPPLGALTTIAGLLTVATLYFGRDVLVPFALAVLLGFVLDPLVTWLCRRGLPRGASVGLVLLFTVATLGATSLFVGSQVMQLSKDLPTYQSTIQTKLRALRRTLTERNALEGTTRLLDVLGGEIDATRRAIDQATHRATPPLARVQVEPAPRSAVQAAADLIGPLLAPVGTAGLVFVFVVYILLERNDLRDRLIRLVGSNLQLTTDALGEAGDRVSRYLTMQLLVNVSYGVTMAAGLALIGVPGALLWGVVAGMMRFLPYIGPTIAAAFPLTLAFAVDPGWQMVMWAAALVITLELLSNNLVEPWLSGASTGLSPVSLILSAVFWTALWGPVGWVLATPLTVCLAVLGRHIPALQWLDTLLGSQPAFDPPTRLYLQIVAALWNAPPALLTPDAASLLGVDAVAHTLIEASRSLAARTSTAHTAGSLPGLTGRETVLPDPTALATCKVLSAPLQAAIARTAQRLADVFDVSAAMVTLIDQSCHVWQAAKNPGEPDPLAAGDAPHRAVLAAWSLGEPQTRVVCDTARDPQLAQQAAVQQAGLRFVAATPLRTPAGVQVGALCVMDGQPRQMSEHEIHLLELIADALMRSAQAAGHLLPAPTGAPEPAANEQLLPIRAAPA